MTSKTIFFAFGVVFLGICFKENVATGGNVSITLPTNRMIKGLGKRKCLVYMWNGLCDNQNCTVKIETTLSKGNKNEVVTKATGSFKPFTTSNKQAVCFYDSCFETNECCEKILSGTKLHAQKTPFSDNYKIALKMDRERLGHKIPVRNSFMLPWKDMCVQEEPCKPYGACSSENPDNYSCKCTSSGWKGKNCSEREGWSVSARKCLKKAKVVQSLSALDVSDCIKGCIDMNSKLRVGCKSFEFTPDSSGKLMGSCKLYDVSKNHGGAELKDCSSWYMDLKDLSAWALSNDVPPRTSGFILLVLNLFFVVFLHI